ncbi:MAG: AbrB/MazE/SpoVT family DNA-binding domain-containing protein [Chloroflexota bacterium]
MHVVDVVMGEWHHQGMSDTFTVTVGPKGRVVIPAPLRHAIGIAPGDEIVAVADGDGILLLPRTAVRARLRRMFAGVGASMTDKLLRERRAEAIGEAQE